MDSIAITAGIAALIWILAPQYASLYIKGNPEALRLAVTAVRCYAIGMPINGLNLIYLNYFQGIDKSRLASISGFLILSAAAMMPSFGADAVWLAYPTYHIGLRMIAGLARDIRYACVLKLNNILVKI